MDKEDPTKRLFLAVKSGDVGDAQAAMDAGAKANSRVHFQDTLLHFAARHTHPTMARLLIKNGAHVNAVGMGHETPLHWAASHGNASIVELLIEHGAKIDAEADDHRTPMQLAKHHYHTDVVTLLENAAKQQGHTSRIDDERKDKGPRQPGG